MAQLRPIQRQGIVTEIRDRIRTAIIKGTLPPGSTLDQNALAEELGVSRVPIREALMLLEQEDLVVLNPRRSPRVAPINPKFLEDAFDFWMTVDGHVASMLAERRDLKWDAVRRLVENGKQTVRPDKVRLDTTQGFHTALYEATGNSVLPTVMRPIWNHIARVSEILMAKAPISQDRELLLTDGIPEPKIWQEHEEILEAIEHGSVKRAAALAQSHVRRARDEVKAALNQVDLAGKD